MAPLSLQMASRAEARAAINSRERGLADAILGLRKLGDEFRGHGVVSRGTEEEDAKLFALREVAGDSKEIFDGPALGRPVLSAGADGDDVLFLDFAGKPQRGR